MTRTAINNSKLKIEIDLTDLLVHEMTAGERKELHERLCCFDDVIKEISELIVTGMTESGFAPMFASGKKALHEARLKVVVCADAVAQESIKELERRESQYNGKIEKLDAFVQEQLEKSARESKCECNK